MPQRASLIDPVIVLPGLTGSGLRNEYSIDHETLWSVTKRDFNRVILHPDDMRYELQGPSRVVPDGVFDIPYQEFIEELRHNLSKRADEPTPVFAFAHDWRQPLDVIEGQLADFIDEVIARTRLLPHYHAAGYGRSGRPGKVNLVGHSLGCSLVAGYIADHGASRVARVATLGGAFRGSHEAVLKATTGLSALGSPKPSSRQREAARLTPALYSLLPSYDGAVIAEHGLSTDLFAIEAWQPGVIESIQEFIRQFGLDKDNLAQRARGLFSTMLAQARAHRTKLERLRLRDVGLESKDWLCVVGLGEETRVRLRIQRWNGEPYFDLTSKDRANEWKPDRSHVTTSTGDGTVPYLGARCSFIPVNELVCICDDDFGYWELLDRAVERAMYLHPIMPEMNLVQRLVISHFQGKPEGKVWGRPAPDLYDDEPWNPPIAGLRRK